KEQTGLDAPVRDYVLDVPQAGEFLRRIDDLLGFLLPCYVNEAKSYMSVAIGCTGGRHRSVVLAEEIAVGIRKQGFGAAVFHRDISR
ncbi:MAG TPA: RNase adapter RapZ, partial [Acidimicrobiales bacterium]|nr:RNase adapter RapZ [Acidimicrobiales bacterium]